MLSAAFDVTAQSAIVIDAASGKVLWEKNADQSMYPASTTKIMTGLLLVENCLPTDVIVAPADIEKTKEASMHLKPGEKVLAKDMLYALMLRSANDGAMAIANHISGSVPAFADLMNKRAKELGCTNTHFHNPNGLNDDLHTTSAHDLARIAREAMTLPWFREVVKCQKYRIERSINVHDRWMNNHDKWLKKDVTAEGIKTGYTVPAGRCFVGAATREDFRVITVVMKSKDWQKDNAALVDYAYQQFDKSEPLPQGSLVESTPVPGGAGSVALVTGQDSFVVARPGSLPAMRKVELRPDLKAPVEKGSRMGDLVITDADGFEQRVPLVAQSAVSMAPLAAATSGGTPWLWGGGLCVGVYLIRRRARRIKPYAPTAPRPY